MPRVQRCARDFGYDSQLSTNIASSTDECATSTFSRRLTMANATKIEWTDATWNPVTGCTKISSGCDNCYAERFSERFRGVAGHPFERGFDLTIRPERLSQPLGWAKPRLIFVNSMKIGRAHV